MRCSQLLEPGDRGIGIFAEMAMSYMTNDAFFLSANRWFEGHARTLAVTLDETKIEETMLDHFSERISEIAPVERVFVAKEDDFYEFYIVVEDMTKSERREIIERECEIEREYPFYFDFHIIVLEGRELTEVIDEDDFESVFDKSKGGFNAFRGPPEKGEAES
ncbi:MAG: hypothetical protein LN416_01400 [Candidatus Thermoplasmatota archaeon]|nr:hypothetical protein [Candidatus Thermoplasmatota archaeon]